MRRNRTGLRVVAAASMVLTLLVADTAREVAQDTAPAAEAEDAEFGNPEGGVSQGQTVGAYKNRLSVPFRGLIGAHPR